MKDMEAAAAAAAQMIEAERAEAEPEVPSSEEEQPGLPNIDAEIPEDLAVELDAPEEDEPADEPFQFTEDYEGYDPQDQEILKRLAAAEKKAAYYEKLRVQEAQKSWKQEAREHFPYSEYALESITATSRRAFLRQARAAQDAVKPMIKQDQEARQAQLEKEREQVRLEEREAAARAWGRPSSGNEAPAEAHEAQVQRARERGDLGDIVRAMVFPKKGA